MAFDRTAFKSDAVDLGRKHFGEDGPQSTGPNDDINPGDALAKLANGEDLSDDEMESAFRAFFDICGDDSDEDEDEDEGDSDDE